MEAVDVAGEVIPTRDADEDQFFKGLSWSQRIQGFLLFFALGTFATVMSWAAMFLGYYWKYTFLYTLGTIMSMLSTIILRGPASQLAYMFDEYRRNATLMYLGSLVLTLFVALVYRSFFLCMLCGLLQYATLAWYSLSYIPYGRETVMAFVFHR